MFTDQIPQGVVVDSPGCCFSTFLVPISQMGAAFKDQYVVGPHDRDQFPKQFCLRRVLLEIDSNALNNFRNRQENMIRINHGRVPVVGVREIDWRRNLNP